MTSTNEKTKKLSKLKKLKKCNKGNLGLICRSTSQSIVDSRTTTLSGAYSYILNINKKNYLKSFLFEI